MTFAWRSTGTSARMQIHLCPLRNRKYIFSAMRPVLSFTVGRLAVVHLPLQVSTAPGISSAASRLGSSRQCSYGARLGMPPSEGAAWYHNYVCTTVVVVVQTARSDLRWSYSTVAFEPIVCQSDFYRASGAPVHFACTISSDVVTLAH